jgi:hypothetical protein
MWLTWLCTFAHAAPATIDVLDGGLMRVAKALSADLRVPFTFEGILLDQPGLHYRDRVWEDGKVHRERVLEPWTFQFTYDDTWTPRQAGEAAVAAWNALPATIAKYTLVEGSRGGYGFEPVELRQPDGSYTPYAALLDTRLAPSVRTGSPTALWHGVVSDLARVSGAPITDGNDDFLICGRDDQGDRTLTTGTATARAWLDEVRGMCTTELVIWTLIYVVSTEVPHWGLTMTVVRPGSDGRYGL